MITGEMLIKLANRWSALTANSGGGEDVWRTAIGRAYYGAFHVGVAFLKSLGIRQASGANKRSVHDWVKTVLQHGSNPDLTQAGKNLGDLHVYRKDADYAIDVTEHGEQLLAQQCHLMAEDIRQLLAKCEEAKPAIKMDTEAWLKMSRY